MKKLIEIFHIDYPKTMILNNQILDPNGTIFISSKGIDNGISARILDNPSCRKYNAGSITVSLKGTVMSAFLQNENFYIAHQNAVLSPRFAMSDEIKLFYCLCLSANRYRYNYGRQADRTLKELLIPSIEELPSWVSKVSVKGFDDLIKPAIEAKPPELNSIKWKSFTIKNIFDVQKGKRLTKENMKIGNVPFIGAIDKNNGCRQFIGQSPIHLGNTITVNYNGSVAEAFYQPSPFWASDDVNVLYPKFNMNQFNALFIISIIKMEKYRYNFGRKWHSERMNVSKIKLPVNENGKPDFEYMENYIKTINYSKQI